MEEIYGNIDYLKSVQPDPPAPRQGSRSSESSLSWYLLPCLGLLSLALLTGLVVVGVLLHLSTTELAATRTNLSELAAIRTNLSELAAIRTNLSELAATRTNLSERLLTCASELLQVSKERALLNASLANRTEELDRLQKSCRIGWTLFNNFCYFFSCELKSWEASRQNCRQVGADLVVVDTSEEQKFLSKNVKKDTWIGLNDVETEGTWKWTDGNPLTKGYWYEKQPDNGNNDPKWGEEDCAHLYIADTTWEANWNDISCNKPLQWVCEKKLG
ncbi:CD209 antigen-like protein C isoform X1 [Takifugu flavidus]|uniref:CD209 antigen-like protein C isoform X1 n=1 Tax=Takifugu flavidus TaxID=433684 RepID=UPI0025447541|nr:CD209 antigen-like protein C isoform X1 [Takifugu flavidus]